MSPNFCQQARRVVTLALASLALTSCFTTQVYSGSSTSPTMKRSIAVRSDTPVGVSVNLCALCRTPYDFQVEDARKLLVKTCQGDFTLLEEGEKISASNMTYITPVAGAWWAQTGVRYYYWVARCDRSRT